MNAKLREACNQMALALGYAGWDGLSPSMRIPVMQLVQLQIIATQLEEIDRSLNLRGQ